MKIIIIGIIIIVIIIIINNNNNKNNDIDYKDDFDDLSPKFFAQLAAAKFALSRNAFRKI